MSWSTSAKTSGEGYTEPSEGSLPMSEDDPVNKAWEMSKRAGKQWVNESQGGGEPRATENFPNKGESKGVGEPKLVCKGKGWEDEVDETLQEGSGKQ